MRVIGARVGWADFPPGSDYGPRTLTDWEIVWVIDGAATWSRRAGHHDTPADARSDILALAPGDVLVIPPGRPDHLRWHPRRNTRHGWIHLDLDDPPAGARPGDPPLIHRAGGARGARSDERDLPQHLCRYALSLATAPAATAAPRLARTVDLLISVLLTPPEQLDDALSDLSNHVIRAARFVGRRYYEDGPMRIPLDDLARAAGLSARQFGRATQRDIGVGAVHAFEAVRLHRAATLLSRSNLSVTAVAAAAGYGSLFQFSRQFRAVVGVAPSAFRALPEPEQRRLDPAVDDRIRQLVAVVASAEDSSRRRR